MHTFAAQIAAHPQLAALLAFLVLAGTAAPARAKEPPAEQIDAVPVERVTYRPKLRADARVSPVHLVTAKAGLTGVIEDLWVRPGQGLSAGAIIAHLGGPDQAKAMADAQAQLSAAEQNLTAATDAEQAVGSTYHLKLSDRAALDRAKVERAAAEARLASAKAELARLQALSTIVSPVAGAVVSLAAANGDRVEPGDPVLVLQRAHDLWLQAVFYGAPTTVFTPGRAARFLAVSGAKELAVRLAQVLPSLRPDGGLTAFFEPAVSEPQWRGGEAGEVVLAGEPQPAIAIPTAALILDQGRWWVLTKTAGGLHRQAVDPGPSRGEQALILHGLKDGEQVVVRDAYLLFHRDFGQHYTPPD
jgi:RND family efflux transporter MFP subunit